MTTTPNGAAGHLFIEDVFRKYITSAFVSLSETASNPLNDFVDMLFSRYGETTAKQVREYFTITTNINVVVNYPREDFHTPFVAIINAGEQSPDGYMGDYGGYQVLGSDQVTLFGGDTRPRATKVRKILSVPEKRTIQIMIGADETNAVAYIYTVIKALLIRDKIDFDKYAGVREMTISGADLQYRQEFLPQFAYMKTLTLSFATNFDVPLVEQQTVGGVSLVQSVVT